MTDNGATPVISLEDAINILNQVLAQSTVRLGEAPRISEAFNVVVTAARAPRSEEVPTSTAS